MHSRIGQQPAISTTGKNFAEIFISRMESAIETLSAVLTAEVGKPLQQSRNEINGARTRIKWLTENAEKYLGEEQMRLESGSGRKNFLRTAGSDL